MRVGTKSVNMGSEATSCDGRIVVFHVIATPPERLLLPIRSAGQVQESGSAHGTRIDEVSRWKGWEVGVVTAAVRVAAALRGEWYYDSQPGFLVGVTKSTAVSGARGLIFNLTDSNRPDLGLPLVPNRYSIRIPASLAIAPSVVCAALRPSVKSASVKVSNRSVGWCQCGFAPLPVS